ncbi:MAG: hypothetical protein KAR38_02815 [Calditrichia bacterium]|nr:hypothetical protein [Calditrichia bacterium]
MKYNKILFLFIIITTLLSLLINCKDVNKDDFDFPLENLSYYGHIRPLLLRDCTYNSCHNTNTEAGGVNFQEPFLTTDDLEFARPTWGIHKLVDPGFPETSMLFEVIQPEPDLTLTVPMPPITSGYEPMTKKEREAIRTWIIEGAKIDN